MGQYADKNISLTLSLQIWALKAFQCLLKPFQYKGYGRITRYLSDLIFGRNRSITVKVHSDSVFVVPLDDPYWSLILREAYIYEEDMLVVLEKVLGSDVAFLDCGANFGYWSLYAGEKINNPNQVIAVEASSTTLARLNHHNELNNNRFTIIHAAVDSVSGNEVELVTQGESHAGAKVSQVIDHSSNVKTEKVMTLSMDDLMKQQLPNFGGPVVLKLDVEGFEINTLKGASDLCKGDIIIAYEDLGVDDENDISQFIWDMDVFDIYYYGPGTGLRKLDGMDDVREVRKIKSECSLNLYACSRNGELAKRLNA